MMVRLWQVTFLMILCPTWCLSADRYAAMFADGTRAEESEVREWSEVNSPAKIGGRLLFDVNNPVRWIIDRNQSLLLKPSMYIEFSGGDRLAGEVISYADGRENPYEVQSPHFIVRPVADVQPPDIVVHAELRVTTDWVQRIVWENVGSAEYRPGTAWMRTGNPLSFRSLRWSKSGVTLLTSAGVKEISMSDIGEIHLPKIDPWTAYYEQLAVTSPDARSRMIQMDGTDGSRWTTSVERFQSRHHGDRNRPEQWYQLIQPAWSLDSIWLRYRTICAWRFFSPDEVPLTIARPTSVKQEAVFGTGRDWQIDRNALGGSLRSSDQEFGWGIGVQGTSELAFDLPAIASGLRFQYGLDRIAGTGGCVNLDVLDRARKPLLTHSNLIGSAFVSTLPWSVLTAGSEGDRHIKFRTEMAHRGRPSGADPFDVRDFINWYEPEVRLDQAGLETEVRSRNLTHFAGLAGWTLLTNNTLAMKVANIVDTYDVRDPQFRPVLRTTDRFYILSRKIKVGPRDRWLAVVASRFAENTSPSTMQIRVDGRVFGEFQVPIRNSMADPEPMLVSVPQFQGRTVTVDVVVYPTDEKSWVDWRGFAIGSEQPGLLTIFEDDEKFATVLNRGSGQVELDDQTPYSGKRCLKVTPDAGHNSTIPDLEALICENPRLGQYRHILFAWKKSTGSRIQVHFANQGRLGDTGMLLRGDLSAAIHRRGLRRSQTIDERGQRLGYSYEQGVATTKAPVPLWLRGDLPRNWQLVQRDLFNDFGLFWMTGLSLDCVDGDAAWFDHIYLARTHLDLEYATKLLVNPQPAPPQPDGNGHLVISRREDYAAEFSRIAPLFSTLEMAHGLTRQIEHNGQTDVLRTHANDQDKPLVFHAGIVLPKDRLMMLNLHVTHRLQCDWQLVVRANGEILTDQLIDASLTTPQRGWATIQIDLSKFAGQNVLLEVLNQSNNWKDESAFWKRIELVDQ